MALGTARRKGKGGGTSALGWTQRKAFYIPAGLHIKTDRLEERLTAQLQKALEVCPADKIIVVQGARCFVSPDDPSRRIDDIIHGQAPGIKRVQAAYGYDMLAGKEERNEIAAGGDKGRVLWFTPGWLKKDISDLLYQVGDLVKGHRAAGQQIPDGATFHVAHDDRGWLVGALKVVDRQDVQVLQAGDDAPPVKQCTAIRASW